MTETEPAAAPRVETAAPAGVRLRLAASAVALAAGVAALVVAIGLLRAVLS